MQNKNKIFLISVFLMFVSGTAFASETVPNLAKLKSELGKDIKISIDKQTGKLNFLAKKDEGAPLWKAKNNDKENKAISRDFLREFSGYFGVSNPDRDLKLLKETEDGIGMSHLRYNQKINDVPVFGGQLIVHIKDKQAVTAVNGSTKTVSELDTNPKINQGEAVRLAKEYWVGSLKGEPKEIGDPKLYIYNKQFLRKDDDSANYLVWEINLFSLTPYQHELYYIDAGKGSLIDHRNVIKKAVDRRVYNCKAWSDYSDCTLDDPVNLGLYAGREEGEAAVSNADIDGLYSRTGSIHDYYVATFSRNGANDAGGLGNGTTNLYTKTDSFGRIDYDPYRGYYCPDNAYFEDNALYGGATINFCENSATKDVVGHEYAHGLSYYSILDGFGNPSGLIYAYESGAIEEANADVFGEALENYIDGSSDWLLGEDIPSGPFRNMSDPASLGYPDRFNSPNFYCGSDDNGGVHINSTVITYAAYLMANGGTFNGCTIGAIGRVKEEAIFYKAIQDYLTINAGFNDAFNALSAACADLYGGVDSTDCQNVRKALSSVELDQGGACSGEPAVAPILCDTTAPSVSGAENGQTYRTDIAPTFNEGTATLNGQAFSSGQTVTDDGDYTLIVTDLAGNVTTITFKIEKVVSSVPALTYKRKKATSRMILTFYHLNLNGKLKRKNFKVRFNGRRANIARVRNTADGLVINMRFNYAKWPRGQYNLVMSYNYKSGRILIRGGANKNNLFSIN